jgi:hypothetical protein
MKKEDLDQVCFNCNHFFPVIIDEPSEFGICLNDKEFEPFIDELLENSNYACCQSLIDCKKFDGNRDACPDFSEVEVGESFEIDESTEFGQELVETIKSGQFSKEKLEEIVLREQIRNIDFKTLPVEKHTRQLKHPDPQERDSAISTLGSLIFQENKDAFHELFNFLKQLPPLETIEEVHFKKRIFRYFVHFAHSEHSEFRTPITQFLLDELNNTPSNNTTRQWISSILQFLESCPLEEISDPLEKMLTDNRFSYRLKKRIENILLINKLF